MELNLKGRRAVVTGASEGIGLAIAERLTAEGCAVALCSRSEARISEAAERLRVQAKVVAAAVDVTDAPALEAFVAHAADELGGLDLLVANAGGAVGGPRLAEAGAEEWRQTLDLNLVHSVVAARAAVPHMRAAGGGSILFISSLAGVRPQPRPQYAASKAAVNHLAALLARELGPDRIRVNALSPGSIAEGTSKDVRLRGDHSEAEFEAFVAREFPLGRLGTLDEVADVAAFLSSPRAGWINGATIAVDGAQLQSTIEGY